MCPLSPVCFVLRIPKCEGGPVQLPPVSLPASLLTVELESGENLLILGLPGTPSPSSVTVLCVRLEKVVSHLKGFMVVCGPKVNCFHHHSKPDYMLVNSPSECPEQTDVALS